MALAVHSIANGARAVCVEVEVWGGGPVGQEEEAAPLPGSDEGPPPLEVELEELGEWDGCLEGVSCGAEVNHPL